jgi:uncharacterized protein YkwD
VKYFGKIRWESIAKVFLLAVTFTAFVSLLVLIFSAGFRLGAWKTSVDYQNQLQDIINQKSSSVVYKNPTLQPATAQPRTQSKTTSWGGPDLWKAVNDKRITYGVNPLGQKDEFCTIASIRLNELLNLGKLDGHEGFSNLPERRTDLKYIFEKYVVAEFLVSGADSPEEAVALWDNTLGHKKLLTGGEYAYGCIYAQNGFGVAIAGYE